MAKGAPYLRGISEHVDIATFVVPDYLSGIKHTATLCKENTVQNGGDGILLEGAGK